MRFAEGFDDKPCTLRVQPTEHGVAEVWIEHVVQPTNDCLVYATLDELLALKKEIDVAVTRMFGIGGTP